MINKFKTDVKVNGFRLEKLFILIVYRLGNYIYYSNFPYIIKNTFLLILNIIRKVFIVMLFHVEIPFECKIGSGLKLMHPHSIVLHKNVVIGDNCTIFHGCTIGSDEKKIIMM